MDGERKVPEAVREARRSWIEAVEGTDVAAYSQIVTEDVVWIPPGQPPVEGRRAFRQWLKPFFEGYRYDFSLEVSSCRVAGDRVIEKGTFQTAMTPRSGGETVEHEGRYIVHWRKEVDGAWRIERYEDDTAAASG